MATHSANDADRLADLMHNVERQKLLLRLAVLVLQDALRTATPQQKVE